MEKETKMRIVDWLGILFLLVVYAGIATIVVLTFRDTIDRGTGPALVVGIVMAITIVPIHFFLHKYVVGRMLGWNKDS